MGHKKKMTPAQKASARWEDEVAPPSSGDEVSAEEEPVNGDHFIIALVLIGIVTIAAIVYSAMQGGF